MYLVLFCFVIMFLIFFHGNLQDKLSYCLITIFLIVQDALHIINIRAAEISTSRVRMKEMEATTTEHQCEQCEKVFTLKKNLNQYVRAVHAKEKKHECELCCKKFVRKQNMKLYYKTCFHTKVIELPTLKEVRRTDLVKHKIQMI